MRGAASGAHVRRHQRIAIYHIARVAEESRWHDCTVVDLSEDGALLAAPAAPEIGAPLVLCSEEIGLLAGTVIRHSADGFAIIFEISGSAKAKLIAWLAAHLSGLAPAS